MPQASLEYAYKLVKEKLIDSLSDENNKNPIPAWKKPYLAIKSYNFVTNQNRGIGNINPYSFVNQMLLDEGGLFCTYNQIANLNTPDIVAKLNSGKITVPPISAKGAKEKGKIFFEIPSGHVYVNKYSPAINKLPKEKRKELSKLVEEINTSKIMRTGDIPEELNKLFKDDILRISKKPYVEIYSVFNINDIKGLPEDYKNKQIQKWKNYNNMKLNSDISLSLEQKGDLIIDAYFEANPDIKRKVQNIDSPHYSRHESIDGSKIYNKSISLPLKDSVDSLSSYYSICFHEIAHSTMHNFTERNMRKKHEDAYSYKREELVAIEKRIGELNKEKPNKKELNEIETLKTELEGIRQERSRLYDKVKVDEELIAEMTASVMCSYLGLNNKDVEKNNLAYCASWKNTLTQMSDKEVFDCFKSACKAADFIVQTFEKKIENTNELELGKTKDLDKQKSSEKTI